MTFSTSSKNDGLTRLNNVTEAAKGDQLNLMQLSELKSVIADEKALLEFAESAGLKAKITDGEWAKLCHRDLPSVVKYTNNHYILVIRASDDSVLLYDQSTAKTSIVSKDLFLSRWSGYALTFHRHEREL